MISAPSRLLPLSGNKLPIAFVLAVAFILPGCELFTKAQSSKDPSRQNPELDPIQGRRVYDPETGTYVVVKTAPTEAMDTVRWKLIPASIAPPIVSVKVPTERVLVTDPVKYDPYTGSELLEAYNVVFALPFVTDRFSAANGQVPPQASWALNFYAGAKMALEELKAEGAQFNVAVMDTKASEAGMNDLIFRNQDFANAHLIIGPYRRENVRLAAEAVKNDRRVLLSPYFTGENMTMDNNPNYIQMNPSLQTHSEALLRYARRIFRPEQIVLVCRNRPQELERLKAFQDLHRQMQAEAFACDTASLREFIIAEEGEQSTPRINAQALTQNRDTLAIIVPSWSNETFINTLLQQLNAARGASSYFTVFGMPQWMEYERIDYNLYQNLNLHLSSSYYINREIPAIQDFQRNYFNQVGILPAPEAFMGYDMTLYACRMLRKYGTRFQFAMENAPGQGLHTRFEPKAVRRQGQSGGVPAPEGGSVRFFENKFVNILKFEDYRFVKVN